MGHGNCPLFIRLAIILERLLNENSLSESRFPMKIPSGKYPSAAHMKYTKVADVKVAIAIAKKFCSHASDVLPRKYDFKIIVNVTSKVRYNFGTTAAESVDRTQRAQAVKP